MDLTMTLTTKILLPVFALILFSSALFADQHAGFTATTINKQLSLLQGKGGNILVSHGEDGLLIIDNDYSSMTAPLLSALDQFGGKQQLRFIINTHWHGDHTGGNAVLGEHATIIGHDNVRQRLSSKQEIKAFKMVTEPAPKQALPTITYPQSTNIHFNGETIHLRHYPNAHTDSDSVIHFKNSNVIHMGDLMFNGMFPLVDTDNAGSPLQEIEHPLFSAKKLLMFLIIFSYFAPCLTFSYVSLVAPSKGRIM